MNFVVRGRDPKKGIPWEVSFETLANGSARGKNQFRGRPALLSRLMPGIEIHVREGAESSAKREKYQLYYFWRFLGHLEGLSASLPGLQPVSIDDVDWNTIESVWRQFIDWLRAQPAEQMSNRMRYYLNSSLCAIWRHAFEAANQRGDTDKTSLDVYVYFKDHKAPVYGGDPLNFEEAKQAFRALADAWRSITKRVERGRSLAASGTNPMVGSGGSNRWQGGPWQSMANRLWAAFTFLPAADGMDERAERRLKDGLGAYELPDEWRVHGIDRSLSGVNAHLSCLYFTRAEMAVAMAMVSMKTGMNPDSISRMEVAAWHRPDIMQADKRVIVFGPKRIGNYNLTAASSISRLTDPYQVIKRIIDVQAPLRERLLQDGKRSGNQELIERSKLVWVFPNASGEIVDFTPDTTGNPNTAAAQKLLDAFFDARNVRRKDGSPMQYKFSDGRDIWGLFVYHKSGFNHLLTAQALGHSSLTSLLHYLEKRVIQVEDRKRIIDLQARVLTDLERGEYRPRSYRDAAPAIQMAQTASTGLQCTDPLHPDAEADPGNPGGRICRSQGCWTCGKWYATKESVPYLLRIISDLKSMRDTVPVALWETSDYPVMLSVYEHIVGKFSRAIVDAERPRAASMTPIISPRQFVGRR